jgi:hypothetical protein
MKLLTLAVERQDWKLAAHIVVYKAAEVLLSRKNGAKPDVSTPKGSPPGQPKRS